MVSALQGSSYSGEKCHLRILGNPELMTNLTSEQLGYDGILGLTYDQSLELWPKCWQLVQF